MSFLGEFEATIDSKGRFLLPIGFKKQLSGLEGQPFVINRGFETCLTLYPVSTWDLLFAKIMTLNDFDPKVRAFRRYFLNGATKVELDSAGRLLLPKNLAEYAGLEKEIVLTAALNKIEIWDTKKYNQFFDGISSEDFSEIANQVLGNNHSTIIGFQKDN